MQRLWVFALTSISAALAAGWAWAGDAAYYVIPYDADPPIQIDGALEDWDDVPNPLVLNRSEQVTYRPQTWTGPGDLSGTVRLAWREGLCIAAEVTDDVAQQPYAGRAVPHCCQPWEPARYPSR